MTLSLKNQSVNILKPPSLCCTVRKSQFIPVLYFFPRLHNSKMNDQSKYCIVKFLICKCLLLCWVWSLYMQIELFILRCALPTAVEGNWLVAIRFFIISWFCCAATCLYSNTLLPCPFWKSYYSSVPCGHIVRVRCNQLKKYVLLQAKFL